MSEINKKIETPENTNTDEFAITYFSKDLIGISANSTQRRRKYPRQQVRNFLKDPFLNYEKLQEISQYLKATSGNYFRIIKYLSGILTLDYLIYPNSKSKMDNKTKVKTDYSNAAKMLEKMNIKYNFRWILERLIENGEIYLYEIEDSKGIVYKEIPPSFCRISAVDNGVYMYEINLNKIQSGMLDSFPIEIQNAKKNDNTGNGGWYQVGKNGFAFNAVGDYSHGFPVLCMMFDDVMGLEDIKDLTEDKTKLDSIKLIHQRIPLKKDTDEPVFDMKTARIYHDATKKGLPSGIAITTNPLEITQIPFDKSMAREIDTIERAERNIWNSSGISDMIFSNNKASGEALKRSIIADESLMFPFLVMFSNYINNRISGTRFTLRFLEVSHFGRDEKIKMHKDLLGYGSSRMEFLALQGYEPIQVLNMLEFEQNVLDIDRYMTPKQTSHTLSGDDNNVGGRPTQEDVGGEVKDNTELDRERR